MNEGGAKRHILYSTCCTFTCLKREAKLLPKALCRVIHVARYILHYINKIMIYFPVHKISQTQL